MISSPSFTNMLGFVSHEFDRLRMQSLKASFIAKVIGRNHKLKILSDAIQANLHNKRYLGIQNISVDRVVGTLSRTNDFDANFRPRKKHLRSRWVNVFIQLESDGWAPILVHQVGNDYFVEDGHHRVSIARSLGMMFIEAEVWDHSTRPAQPSARLGPRIRAAKKTVESCATD